MSNNIKKIVDKLKRSQADVSFDELYKILIHLGYSLNDNGGSHRIFKKQGFDHVNIPFARPIKKHYVKKVLDIYEEENTD
ncbi:hypothetical protein CFVI92203_09200 [Campylobacter fetus subsp. venerealis cfvi92/203]|uniref:type II toxin-antitoxin system HicA family toxin n=1 Tax=Campylobacter fetus TaxID=196 RepID=UPI0008189456|nr:type II toxin-antitoxin system HicA family toxin [Campylobacter fetus]OCS40129.1 hypothetical protein CFVI92203_09200 [Campylobacter fetus subsp. venerealis cfvi92/203]